MLAIAGQLDREAGEALLVAVGALSAPTTAGDTRTSPQRRADALVEICHQVMNTATLPEVAGERPTSPSP